MESRDAARVLKGALGRFRGELTVADAAARGALALRDAETGLHQLVTQYNGHLAATEKGELVFKFPDGLVDPPEKRLWRRALRRVGKTLGGIARFFIRAWVSVVLIGYVVIFAAVLIAMAMRKDGDNDVGAALAFLMRGVAEALFWTFHPFSPFYLAREPRWAHPGRRLRGRPREPFYEKVNRFVFGPAPTPEDPRATLRALLSTIRAQAGRIGLSDVVRVTGLPRGQADAQMSRLLLDFEGQIDVTDDGAIIYRFPDLRTTAAALGENEISNRPPAPFWKQSKTIPPITGNKPEFNFLVGALNGFNFLTSGYALANSLTIERLTAMLSNVGRPAWEAAAPLPPADGLPWVLGVIPFVFSSMVFTLPFMRVMRRRRQIRKVQAENGRAAVAAHVMSPPRPRHTRADLETIWQTAAGRPATERELLDAVKGLGGEHDVDEDGTEIFRFDDLVREQQALKGARAAASAEEARPGVVVFSSD